MTPMRVAFVMEQTLGHVTHFRNLQAVAAEQEQLIPTWLPITFEARGVERFLPIMRSNWSVRASWRARRALDAALAARPHHAVVFHTQVTSLFSASLMRRIPSIISLDATPINYDSVGRYYGHRPDKGSLLDRQKYRLNRDALQAAVALVGWSEWVRRSLIDDYGVDASRITVLAPGAAPAYFTIGERRHGEESREERLQGSRHSLVAPQDEHAEGRRPVRLLFVGGDFRRKGGPLLLECLRHGLAGRCELHLVTQEPVAPQEHVYVHHGLRPNSPELLRLFAQADVFVLPSRADCLAVALMEAAAAGLPVITTDVGALSEAIRPGQSGLLVRAGDARALYDAIATLVEDEPLRRRMGRESLALARAKFDARANNRALLELVARVASAPRAAHDEGGQRRVA